MAAILLLGAGGAACSSSSASPGEASHDASPAAHDSGTGTDATHGAKDATAHDAVVESIDGTATDAADTGPAGPAGTPGCYTLSGSGSSQQCTVVVPAGSAGCSAGATAGACPTVDLYGCCIITNVDAGADSGAFTATCYYSSAVGAPAESTCEDEAYQGVPSAWDTSSP